MIEKYGKLIWHSSPEGGVVILALAILGIIYLLFYKKN